jgi:hypothetical protein
VCLLGTDCQDCGPVGKSNFTATGGFVADSSEFSDSSRYATQLYTVQCADAI